MNHINEYSFHSMCSKCPPPARTRDLRRSRHWSIAASITSCLKYKSSAVAQMGDRGHNRHQTKSGGCCALFRVAGSPSNNSPGPRPTSVPSGIDPIQAFCTHKRHEPKIQGLLCPFLGGVGSTCNNVAWAEAYPLPSGILVHAAVWLQYMGQ